MKRFYYTEHKGNLSRTNGGWKVEGAIYTVSRGKLCHVTEYECYTGRGRGAKSEVFQALIQYGAIPKRWKDVNDGYFCGEAEEYYSIDPI